MPDDGLPPGGRELSDDPPWDPWCPEQVAALLAGVSVQWCVAAGWALDLFRGGQSREHEDLEIAVPDTAADFGAVARALAGYEIEVVGPGRRLPVDSPAFGVLHQTWVADPATGHYKLDIFREPQRNGRWVCRRDESIELPYERVIARTAGGIQYLVPEVVLLFKAKLARPKDDADLAGTLPLLGPGAREWLRGALQRVHPGHRWLGVL